MKQNLASAFAGLLSLLILGVVTVLVPPSLPDVTVVVLFTSLLVVSILLSIYVKVGFVSLQPATTEATLLVLGPVWAAWIAFAAAIIGGLLQFISGGRVFGDASGTRKGSWQKSLTNASIQSTAILGAGFLFQSLGGEWPINEMTLIDIPRLAALGACYLTINYFLAGIYLWTTNRAVFHEFRQAASQLFAYEGITLLFAPFMAIIYNVLGLLQFLTFAVIYLLVAVITRRLVETLLRLERRVQELDSLSSFSRVLSASLDIDRVLENMYYEVAQLMPAEHFYIAFYDKHTDEVTFPIVYSSGERVHWRPRKAGNRLTEHILRGQSPLLIQGNINQVLSDINLETLTTDLQSYLGVPIIVNGESVGVIAIHSADDPVAFDRRHRQILETIAANAGIAIQNARLYAQTDEALARRVQELDSILRASTQGILLLSSEWDVLAANMALADFVDLPTQQIKGKLNESDLITRIGYTDGDLARDCLKCLEAGGAIREVFNAGDNTLERTLVSVRNEVGQVSGWLMIFRDLTEETKLKEMQAELTQTMVHDLRSPLSSMIGYLNLLKFEIQPEGRQSELYFSAMEMLSEQMLDMVNELLDINRLESGDMPLYKTEIALSWLLENAVAAFQSLAEQSEIDLGIIVDPATPTVVVDPDHMQRVVNNLVDNALKYAPEGGQVRLEARGNGTGARLLISDNGPGIEKSDMERIFQKFHQVTRKPVRRRGSGLGLSYCKLVVEAHDGSITVESEPGQGATFIVDLPVKA